MGDGEGGVSVLRGVEQTHVDELGAGGAEVGGGSSRHVGDVGGFLGHGAQLGHGTQVGALQLGGTVEADPEVGSVELGLVGGDGGPRRRLS